MDKKKIFVTKEGYEELKREYNELVKEKRPAVIERVAQARAMGDLSENSEYHAAKDELSLIDGRIEELSEIMKNTAIIEEQAGNGSIGVVQLGSRVKVSVGDKHEVFTLVGEWEADPRAKKISHESPLGKALIGKEIGQNVEVTAPAGKINYTIVEVK